MTDEEYMREALMLAKLAAEYDEAPVGAIVVSRGVIVGRGYNRRETDKDATAHAEILALRQACATVGGWRIPESVLYVTLEPCPMCAGALVNSRIGRLVYGAGDPKAGAAGTVLNITCNEHLNHRMQVTGGVLAEDCAALLKDFFAEKRRLQSLRKQMSLLGNKL